jgi:hypothetical protein
VEKAHFRLKVNPILQFSLGKEQGDSLPLFANRRGLELSGDVDNKVWFYTSIVEQQARFPEYVDQRINSTQAMPGAGSYKLYKSRFIDYVDDYDYNLATAYIGIKASKHIGLRLGHGKQFLGNGYRSLLLSDFGNNHFFLQANTRVWRFHYQNIFLELSPFGPNYTGTAEEIPNKYAAIHYLSIKPTKNTSIGFFEATVFNRSRQFELQYLNPVIFYRSIEQLLGSSDNAILGINAQADLFKQVRLYGQLLLDEFVFSEFVKPEQKGWWGNKYSVQAGIKYFNAFNVNNLDIQLEYNIARPYTYSHFDSLNSWSHYRHPLAHPLGANFREFIAIARYQPFRRLLVEARAIQILTGLDAAPGDNWGSNLLYSYDTREKDYGNSIGQGLRSDILLLGLDLHWQLFHNCILDLTFLRRDLKNTQIAQRSTLFTGGVRLNIAKTQMDF